MLQLIVQIWLFKKSCSFIIWGQMAICFPAKKKCRVRALRWEGSCLADFNAWWCQVRHGGDGGIELQHNSKCQFGFWFKARRRCLSSYKTSESGTVVQQPIISLGSRAWSSANASCWRWLPSLGLQRPGRKCSNSNPDGMDGVTCNTMQNMSNLILRLWPVLLSLLL